MITYILDAMCRDVFIQFKTDQLFNLFRQLVAQQAEKSRVGNNQQLFKFIGVVGVFQVLGEAMGKKIGLVFFRVGRLLESMADVAFAFNFSRQVGGNVSVMQSA